jgi:hypothetical protein
MITAGQRQILTLEADFYAYDGGPAINLTGITLTITDPNAVTEAGATSNTGITNPAIGTYDYVWTVPATAPVGIHVATWSGTYNSTPVTATETIQVSAVSGNTWCTTADVLTFAKATVDETTLLQAGADIDVECGRPYNVFVANLPAGYVCQISAMDLYWLKLACAYQAAWISTQPDLYSRSDVTAVGRGKANVQFTPSAMTLAPKARVTLNRVSWLKSRSVHVPGPEDLDRPWLGLGIGGALAEGGGWRSLGPV